MSRGKILLVCTGNQCRSPMAAAILSHLLAQRGSSLDVDSAGFVTEGDACPDEVNKVMAPLGYDMSTHRSKAVSPALLASAHLVLGMTRQHAVELSLLDPSLWSRTFTLSEVVRLGGSVPSRRRDESLKSWVDRIGVGRHRALLLGLPLSEDLPDPIGKSLRTYMKTRDRLLDLATRLAELVEPV